MRAPPRLDDLAPRLARAMGAADGVLAALVFGSVARGEARPGSDIDLGVLVTRERAAPARRAATLRGLLDALAREELAERVHLVILNDAPPALAFRALRDGRVIHAPDPVPIHRFRVRTYGAHADYLPVEAFFRAAIKRRALARGRRDG